jgi:hypothetical protein
MDSDLKFRDSGILTWTLGLRTRINFCLGLSRIQVHGSRPSVVHINSAAG